MLTVTEDSRQLDRLGQAIRAYKLASGRTLTFAMIKTGRELAYALHTEVKKIAPTEATIRELPSSLGWRIKRRSGAAIVEIQRRMKHLHFMQSGWLPAIRGFGRDRETTFAQTNVKKLGALIARHNDQGDVSLDLINRAGPARRIHEQHGIVRKAVAKVMRGFQPYIRRKLGDEAVKAFRQI